MEGRVVTRVIVDIACLAAVGVPILLLKYLANPSTHGYYCSDLSIGYPYHGSTIPTSVNVSVSYGVPIILIILFNISKTFITGDSISAVGKQVWEDITLFLFGVFTVQMLSGVCKQTTGRLRPHFLSVCQPGQVDCGTYQQPVYVMNYTCAGNSDLFPEKKEREHRVREARLSFLSGHASLATYGMVYSIIYIQTRSSRTSFPFIPALMQVLLALYALVTSVSRVTDNKHHPTDVIAGAVLGVVMAILVGCRGAKYTNSEIRSGAEFKVP